MKNIFSSFLNFFKNLYDPVVAVDADGTQIRKSEADEFFGQGYARDIEFMKTSIDLVKKAVSEAGKGEYTGRTKISFWTHKKKKYFHALAETDFGAWQGGSLPMGYYTSSVTRYVYERDKAPVEHLEILLEEFKK